MTSLLRVDNVKKRFCRNIKRSMWYGVQDIASDLLALRDRPLELRKDEFLAVDDVSFEVNPGESVALIGRNGAGKSTLLKMINGLFPIDAGQISINGRVSALIELGSGFNPVLSGRENIYVNAAVLGMSKREVDSQLDEIIDFSELEEFIDMPLKSYSSGMKVRLGFAVASQLNPELLLIDEVLAVGDAAFRAKCYRRLAELLSDGTAFVLVSHSHHTLLATCSRGVVLERGKMIANDNIADALRQYDKVSSISGEHALLSSNAVSKNPSTTGVSIRDVFFRSSLNGDIGSPKTGADVTLCIVVKSDQSRDNIGASVVIRDSSLGTQSQMSLISEQDGTSHCLKSGLQEMQLRFHCFPFIPGNYVAKLSVNAGGLNILDSVEAYGFNVDVGAEAGASAYYCTRSWAVIETNDLSKYNSG